MSSEYHILKKFKNDLIYFIDELIEQFPTEGDLIVARFLLKDKIPIVDIMNHVILELLPIKGLVEERDERFFLENDVLFRSLDGSKVNHFKRLWRSGVLDESNKEVVWSWFSNFIRMAEMYQEAKIKNVATKK